MIIELVEAVGGALDDPYDPARTRADYVEDKIMH
jgi:hypothetical protein